LQIPNEMRRIDNESDIVAGVARLAMLDRRMAPVIATIAATIGPVPLRRCEPGYNALASIVVSQMVSRASADAIWQRLEHETGGVTARAILALDSERMRAVGLSGGKQRTLKTLADAVKTGKIDLIGLADCPADEAIARLTALKGIGPWTAEVYLLFAAGHPDIFPAGDVALQAAAAHMFAMDKRPDTKSLRQMAQVWSPVRGIAARVLWAYYSAIMQREVVPVA